VRTLLLLPVALALIAAAACRPNVAASDRNAAAAARAIELPRLSGRVVDAAGLLPDDAEARLTAQSAALERELGPQYVIVTVPDLGGEPIEAYGLRLGRAWGIGHRNVNDGLLLIVAPNEHKVRIEVGYGLEKRITDPFAAQVIREDMLPRLGKRDFVGAIEAGSADLIRRLHSGQTDRALAAHDGVVI
jgi:uncharacterized protein